jgi:hypothetical protein
MTEYATLTPDLNLRLPKEIAAQLSLSDRFMIWLDGDTIVLKKIVPLATKTVEHAPEGEPMALAQINEIVHRVRQLRPSRD